ncbi:MAG TPA: 50S ribosomal protein L17 [Candidatus Saccharimonadales bacterium]|nr:50S ribosomal protein L17 [Candidatus Saccharimonadales bacterium]
MIHRVAGRKLGRSSKERTALFRNLATSLILHEKIVTTKAKAKAVKPMVEKLVTRAKVNSIHSRRVLLKDLPSENTVSKLLEVVGPTFKERPGGYLKIIQMGARKGDQAEMVTLMFVEDFSKIALSKVAKEVKKETAKIEKAKVTKPKSKVTKKVKDAKDKTN